MTRPDWATMKIRLCLSICWASMRYENGKLAFRVQGINWFQQQLLDLCGDIHRWIIAPIFPDMKITLTILEVYD